MSFTRKLTTAILAACFVCFPAMAEREQFQCTLLAPTATAGTVLFGNGSAAAPSISFSADTNTGVFRAAEDTLGFALGGAAGAMLTASTLVLAGPSVSATPADATIRPSNGQGTNIGGASLQLYAGQSTGSGAGGPIRFFTSPAGSSGTTANTLTERMRIVSNGDLYVGNGDSSATPANSSIRATNGSGTNIGGANLSLYGGLGTGSGNGGVVAFFTSAAGGAGSGLNSATERMRITSAGEVGIGRTPSSGYMLDIDHPTDTRIGLYNAGTRIGVLQAASSLFSISGVSTNPIALLTNGAERARIKSNGQVRFIPLAADPANAEAGDVYYNSGTNKLRVYNGTAWVDLH